MNQILNIKKDKSKFKKIFKIQLIISLILIIFGIIYFVKILKEKERENNISKAILLNAKVNSVFLDNKKSEKNNIYFGRIICEKIGLDYYIYNKYSESNLRVLPCKFSGENLNENGNICIIGHNYFDNRFFSNLKKLENKDIIILKDTEENIYKYSVYKKYEINEADTKKVIEPLTEKEITLCTCTFNKNKRLIIRAKFIDK